MAESRKFMISSIILGIKRQQS